LPAQSPLKFGCKSRYRPLVLRIEFDALRRDLSAQLGQGAIRTLAFDEAAVRNPAKSSLRRKLFQFLSDFRGRGAVFSDLAAAEVERW
jgi:hypothetical protein